MCFPSFGFAEIHPFVALMDDMWGYSPHTLGRFSRKATQKLLRRGGMRTLWLYQVFLLEVFFAYFLFQKKVSYSPNEASMEREESAFSLKYSSGSTRRSATVISKCR